MVISNRVFVSIFIALFLFATVSAASVELRTLGNDGAPVMIEMFTDFQGPFDSVWYEQTFTLIKENYIDSGDVKFVVRHFPLGIYPDSYSASIAADCAAEQGLFFEYIGLLYDHQEGLGREDLRSYALELGVDMDLFDSCNTVDRIERDVDFDINEGKKKGLTGAPIFFVNGEKVVGAQQYSVFESLILEVVGEDSQSETTSTPVPGETSVYDGGNDQSETTSTQVPEETSTHDGNDESPDVPSEDDSNEDLERRLSLLEERVDNQENILQKILGFFDGLFG